VLFFHRSWFKLRLNSKGSVFFFSLLNLSPGRDFKGHHFQLKKKKKSQRKIHVNTNVAFHRGELRAAGVAPTAFIQPTQVQQFQHLAGAGLILLSRNSYSKSKTAYKPQSLYRKNADTQD